MAFRATLAQLSQIVAARPNRLSASAHAQIAQGVSTDTRALHPGDVFIALQGENFDGHQFVDQALEQGAIAAIVHRDRVNGDRKTASFPIVPVDNTLQAYQSIAHWRRRQMGIPVIAVTGSVGKTTTKELISAALSIHGRVLKTQANYNNEIGVPKTLLELEDSHDYAVIEMGMRGPGEIAQLTEIAAPDVAVITNVGTAHIGRLGSEQAIADAKCELLAKMPSTGIAVLNHDNPRLIATAERVWSGRRLTYGLAGGDIQGKLLDACTLEVSGIALPLPLIGTHNALNYLAAIAVLEALKLDWRGLAAGVAVDLPAGRAQRYELANDILILDETYNAGVESMTAALQLLAQTPGLRHIAVLGEMKELGPRSAEFHYQVGQVVHQLQLDALFILADPADADALADGAAPLPSIQFNSHSTLIDHLKQVAQPGDRILFKASRAVELDKVADQLREHFTAQL